MSSNLHDDFMLLAIEQAKEAKKHGNWPFGAIVVHGGKVVGKGSARDKTDGDVTDHAELMAIREACKTLGTNDLKNCTIYCSNEPCLMCASGIFQANMSRVIIGASRDDLPLLLRPRMLRIENLAEDTGRKIEIVKGVLRDEVLCLFTDIEKS